MTDCSLEWKGMGGGTVLKWSLGRPPPLVGRGRHPLITHTHLPHLKNKDTSLLCIFFFFSEVKHSCWGREKHPNWSWEPFFSLCLSGIFSHKRFRNLASDKQMGPSLWLHMHLQKYVAGSLQRKYLSYSSHRETEREEEGEELLRVVGFGSSGLSVVSVALLLEDYAQARSERVRQAGRQCQAARRGPNVPILPMSYSTMLNH